jgi:hypothetical protein
MRHSSSSKNTLMNNMINSKQRVWNLEFPLSWKKGNRVKAKVKIGTCKAHFLVQGPTRMDKISMPLMQIVLPQDSHQSISFKIYVDRALTMWAGKMMAITYKKSEEKSYNPFKYSCKWRKSMWSGECQTINGWNESRPFYTTNSCWVTWHMT